MGTGVVSARRNWSRTAASLRESWAGSASLSKGIVDRLNLSDHPAVGPSETCRAAEVASGGAFVTDSRSRSVALRSVARARICSLRREASGDVGVSPMAFGADVVSAGGGGWKAGTRSITAENRSPTYRGKSIARGTESKCLTGTECEGEVNLSKVSTLIRGSSQ